MIAPEDIVEISHGFTLIPGAFSVLWRRTRTLVIGDVRIGDLDWQVRSGRTALSPALAIEWNHLCEQTNEASPFVTPAWIESWLNAFEPKAELVIITGRRGGALCGVLPQGVTDDLLDVPDASS